VTRAGRRAADNARHLDGGCVANNPAAVALHEARARFPGEPLECLVSLATGNAPTRALPGAGVGLQGVLGTVIGSASGVARVHECLEDTLPRGQYFPSPPPHPFPVLTGQVSSLPSY
jgi:hypothetical protein